MQLPNKSKKNHPLRTERLQRHWSQRELAERVGATVATVKRWERHTTAPGPYFRLKLTALFGKSEEELGLVEEHSLPLIPLEEEEVSKKAQMDSFPATTFSLWTVPYLRNPYFTGRDDLLCLLDEHLSEELGEMTTTRQVALTQPQAIKGLGGIGKTQIAVEYAYRSREQGQYTHTFWINTASEEAMMTSFTALAGMLPDFPAKNEADQQKLMEAIKLWLEECEQRWLLIFDNVDDLSLIQKHIPRHGNGSILLTTRANAVGSLAVSIEVEKMGFVEGTHLLLRRAQRFAQASDDEVNKAGNIVVALDHFPLALEQAGAYIEETGCSFGNYLQLYQHHRKELLARRGAQTTNYPDSVATTWSLSFQKIAQTNPAAAELLRLCAFLAPDHIPEELLKDGARHWPSMLQQTVTDLFAFDQMLEVLLTFSLVKRLAENHLLSIHRLVQVVQLDRMDLEEQRQWAERVISAVNTVFPRDPKNEIATWPQCLRYLEQAQACATLLQQLALTVPEGADLLNRTGIYLHEHASYALAEPLFQCALHIWEQSLGPEHPFVASSLNNLAELYREQGKYAEAEPLFHHALLIWEYHLEANLAEVATALNGLAILYHAQGKYSEAESLFQRALRIWEQSLGPEHPRMASSLNGLASLYREQGKYSEAESLFQRALRIWEQNLGPEHPRVASSLNGLAALYCDQGKYNEAEPLFQRALRIWEQSLGPEHTLIAYPLNNLAAICREQGKYMEAEPLYQRALRIWEQGLGPEHRLVASLLNNLADLYREQKKYMEAEPLFQRALYIYEQSLEPEHPVVASPLNNLATIYREQGKYALAELFFQRALTIKENAFDPYHPEIAENLQEFANLREVQGNIEEAISLYCRALAIREKVYGQEHPKTIDTRERLHTISVALNKRKE